MHYGNMSQVVTSLKECPEFNSGNPKLNSGRRSHSGMNRFIKQTENEWFLLSASFMAKFEMVFTLTTITGKTRGLLNSVQKFIEIQGWLSLTFFICLNSQLSSFNSIIVQISEKRNSSNRQQKWVVASFSNFHGKIWFGFCLNIRKQFFLGFLF